MKNKTPVENVFTISDKCDVDNEYDKCNTTKIEKITQNSPVSAREENFLYRHKKFDLLENTSTESDEIRSSKSESFSNAEEFSGIDIPVEGAQHEKLNIIAPSNRSPSSDDVEEDEKNDKGWVLEIDNTREMSRVTASASPEFKTFPEPIRIDFDYASTLPKLNTVANFEDKSIVTYRQDPIAPALPSSDYETDMENSSVKLQDSNTDKNTLPPKGAPYYFNTIKANFRDKKLVSYIPRPTLRDTAREFRVEPMKKNLQDEDERKNELKRLKQEELKICNTNLGFKLTKKEEIKNIFLELLSHMFSVHPLVRTRHATKASTLRSVSIQQRQSRHRHALEARHQHHSRLHPREWQ